MAAKKKLTFEQQLSAVEELIGRMESGGMPLDESMKEYEAGVRMISELEKELAAATQRLTVIRENASGEDEEVPLEDPE